jgi:hypothetical protein
MINPDCLTHRTVKRIALACIIQCALDASAGDPTALSWFESTGRAWLQNLDIRFNPEWLEKIAAGQVDRSGLKKVRDFA